MNSKEDYAAYLYLGNRYLALGHIDAAEKEYQRALSVRPCPEIEDLIAALKIRRAREKRLTSAPSGARVGRAA